MLNDVTYSHMDDTTVHTFDIIRDVRFVMLDANEIGDDVYIRKMKSGERMICFHSMLMSAPYEKPFWFACREREGGKISVDMDHRVIPAMSRDTKEELDVALDRLDTMFKNPVSWRPYKSQEIYEDSPTLIKLDPNLRWQERMRGVIFKNIVTGEEWMFGGVMGAIKKKMVLNHYQVNLIIFSGKVIKNWYIDRVDTTVKSSKFIGRGHMKIPTDTPLESICNMTQLTKCSVVSLISGELLEKDGWKIL